MDFKKYVAVLNTNFSNQQLLSILFLALHLITAVPSLDSMIVGAMVSVVGLGLRIWASGYYQNIILTTAGPYAHCRNPRYLGSFLIGLGISIATNNIYSLVIFVVGFTLFFNQQIAKEEQQFLNDFGNEYEGYRYMVPQFIPRLSSRGVPNKENLVFSWVKSLHYNKEIISVYYFIAVWFSLIVIANVSWATNAKVMIAFLSVIAWFLKQWKTKKNLSV